MELVAEEGFGGRCEYTGPLRAVYPVPRLPMRSVPKEIPYPDYAVNGTVPFSPGAVVKGLMGVGFMQQRVFLTLSR